jgi:hypothetical protein
MMQILILIDLPTLFILENFSWVTIFNGNIRDVLSVDVVSFSMKLFKIS